MRFIALAVSFLLAGCATTTVVDAPTALSGQQLETALNLYGRWDERVVLEGRPYYIWRRAVVLSGKTYYCELRAEAGFRNTIKSSIVEGFPAACGLFAVQYTANAERPDARQPRSAGDATVVADRGRSFQPVGAPKRADSATAAGADASARTR